MGGAASRVTLIVLAIYVLSSLVWGDSKAIPPSRAALIIRGFRKLRHERRARRDDNPRGPSKSDRQLHDPEYAQVGRTEAKARETHDAVVAVVRFDETTRTIIDGRTAGFCKLIADRATRAILGCHVVGERAVEIVQVVAVAIAAGMRVDDLGRVPLSFPTYAAMPGRAAYRAAQQLNLEVGGQVYPST